MASVDVADVLNTVIHGDALAVLKTLPSNSLSAMVTDPPAGIGFMLDQKSGRTWDSDKGGRNQWVSWLTDIMREAYRVLMPGAHCLVWALPKQAHWTAWSLENAGFEVRDNIAHLYAQDTKLAAFYATLSQEQRNLFEQIVDNTGLPSGVLSVWGSGFPKSLNLGNGRGSALKPAYENWLLVRKPISEKNLAENVSRWSTGGLNIDPCRIRANQEMTPYLYHSKASRRERNNGCEHVEGENGVSTGNTHPT